MMQTGIPLTAPSNSNHSRSLSVGQSIRHSFARYRGVVVALSLGTLLSGCGVINNMMYKTTGDVMQGFSRDHTIPYLMASGDLAINCAMSEATAPLLMSFGRVTNEPDQLAVMLYLSAGGCAEDQGREHELAALAAMYERKGNAAEDAMIRQKRAYALASKRYLKSWQHRSEEHTSELQSRPHLVCRL